MDKVYVINGCRIKVTLMERSIHITNDRELWQLLRHNISITTAFLVKAIKADFLLLQGKELDISDDSLIVEIWGHVYFEYFALMVQKRLKIKPVRYIVRHLTKASDMIDCGVSGVDRNRKLWDLLSGVKGWIAACLPKNIDRKGWKV